MNPSIFKAYDVRGIYPEEINESVAERIGTGAATFFKARRIAVGNDHRISSPALKEALIRGITRMGVDVADIGLVTTPCAYFASYHLTLPTIVITASHNPSEYNGMKFCRAGAIPVGRDSGLLEIRDSIAHSIAPDAKRTVGKIEKVSVTRTYWKYLETQFHLDQTFRVALDTGSAMGIEDLPFWNDLRHIDVVSTLYDSYTHPCPHEANPMKPETLKDLGDVVRKSKANIGVAYDGDADRIGIVDEAGSPVRADLLAALLMPLILKKYPESKILVDTRASRAVTELVQKHGGTPVFSPVGHAKIKAMMKETGAVFAAELSNHFYYHTPYIAEMGPLPALHILEVLEFQKKPLSALVSMIPPYVHSGELNFHVEDAVAIIERIKEEYKDGFANTLDGIRIDYANWWFSVRASNTESLLRLNVESRTESETQDHVEELTNLFASFGGTPATPHAHSR